MFQDEKLKGKVLLTKREEAVYNYSILGNVLTNYELLDTLHTITHK